MSEILEQLEVNQTFVIQFALFAIFFIALSAIYLKPFQKIIEKRNQSLKNDVEGAKNVGMGNVYYNIKGEKSLPFKPGFDMRDWREIASFL